MNSVPTCPNCGAKFSHRKTTLDCGVCLLPDEIAAGGQKMINRWKNKTAKTTKRSRKKTRHPSRSRAYKHGRQHHVDRTAQAQPRYRRKARPSSEDGGG